jgi:hypothetical protein
MAHAPKPDFVFQRNGRVHLNRRRRQFGWLLAAEVCASAVVVLDTPSSEVVWRVLATHSIRQFPRHFPSCASPCAITFQLDSTLCPHCVYVFCIYLRTNSDLCHLQHKLIGFYNRDEKCLLRGTGWVFKGVQHCTITFFKGWSCFQVQRQLHVPIASPSGDEGGYVVPKVGLDAKQILISPSARNRVPIRRSGRSQPSHCCITN